MPERALKDQLVALFQLTERVHRAYLARARVGDQEVVVLCLKAVSGAERELVSQIGATFARIFNTREHLDIMFLDDPQEADLGRVCKAFFTAPLCEQESEI